MYNTLQYVLKRSQEDTKLSRPVAKNVKQNSKSKNKTSTPPKSETQFGSRLNSLAWPSILFLEQYSEQTPPHVLVVE